MSAFPHEAEIMDLWDAGLGSHAIARRVGLPERRVGKVISRYVDSGEENQHRRACRIASEQLVAATVATGKRFA